MATLLVGSPAQLTRKTLPKLGLMCPQRTCNLMRDLRLCKAHGRMLEDRWHYLALGCVIGGLAGLWLERRQA